MNKNKLKSYAPQARKDFIAAVTARANLLGLSENGGKFEAAPAERGGDIVVIAGQPWPTKVQGQREKLIKRIQKDGFGQTMEAIAYTWFNRFAALRYMELHDYLDHGHRVLSNRSGGMPEILNHATEVDLPGLNKAHVVELKLAGNKDGELYRLLLVAQCNALSSAMPFLFERIDDETELLLPDNLLRTDSIIAKLVAEIPEEDWAQVEIIGWLYQFYISEKKDQVIGKVVKSEDIPAATQLFTPNWIVQYMVQNSVGRLWLMANPTSTLKSQWPYYIEPAEQTPEVNAQLDALIKTRMDEDGGSLNPETITVLDPACGSGHILVEAYELLKGIYLERGYRLRDIPRLILEKNLYGLDIDDRAAQMAGFALLMKARADDRRLLDSPIKLNVLSLQESAGMDLDEFAGHLKPHGVNCTVLGLLLNTFSHAKTFGSLIQIPKPLEDGLAGLEGGIAKAIESGDVFAKAAAQDLVYMVRQATILAMKFDAVVANPPYMGGKGMNPALKDYAKTTFPDSKSDLFAMFIERGFDWTRLSGFNSMVTMQSWMFLSSYEAMREKLLEKRTLSCMVHMGNGVMGIAFGTAATVMLNDHVSGYEGSFSYCENEDLGENDRPKEFPVQNDRLKTAKPDEFKKIPGSPVAYWVDKRVVDLYAREKVGDAFEIREGLGTRDDAIFMRFTWEVDRHKIRFIPGGIEKWIKADKAGQFRRWFGNQLYLLDWAHDGFAIKNHRNADGSLKSRPQNTQYFFREAVSWGKIGSGITSFRYRDAVGGFTDAAPSIFGNNVKSILGLLNSKVFERLLSIQGGTLNVTLGIVAGLPLIRDALTLDSRLLVDRAVEISKADWNQFEYSLDFDRLPFIPDHGTSDTIFASWEAWNKVSIDRVKELKRIEEENNRLFIEAYGLQNELTPEVPEDQITLTRADREKDSQRLISYAIGCMMGRYSLDEPGLIYAQAGNLNFDVTRYQTFPADGDGIIPITDELWFEDDAANRVREFLRAVWSAETVDENMDWLAESLGKKANETPDETIRRYLSSSFFKDHLQTYKKRPIYWLFSSGKQGAFQALVYLHRYHEGTLARMRSEYVVPLTGKIQSRIEMLEKDAESAGSTAARNKISKEIESLRKKHIELLAYDEKLRHYADMRIKLDLDDGVKVNYGKFGDLLAEVKAVTGGSGDE
jgi:hypothetical protein